MKNRITKTFLFLFLMNLPQVLLAQQTPSAERHEFVKRGNNKQELALGDYVVVSVFNSNESASKMTDELKKEFSEAAFGYCSAKSVWYVYMGASKNIEDARMSRDKYRKNKLFQDAWLLTVHE